MVESKQSTDNIKIEIYYRHKSKYIQPLKLIIKSSFLTRNKINQTIQIKEFIDALFTAVINDHLTSFFQLKSELFIKLYDQRS
jgi:hypothetical protein